MALVRHTTPRYSIHSLPGYIHTWICILPSPHPTPPVVSSEIEYQLQISSQKVGLDFKSTAACIVDYIAAQVLLVWNVFVQSC